MIALLLPVFVNIAIGQHIQCNPCTCYPQTESPTLLVCQDNYINEFPILPPHLAETITEILIYNTYITCLPYFAADYISLQSLGESMNSYFDCSCLDAWKRSLPHVVFDSDCYLTVTDESSTLSSIPDFTSELITSAVDTTHQTPLTSNADKDGITTITTSSSSAALVTTTETANSANPPNHSPETDTCPVGVWIILGGSTLVLICIFMICGFLLIWHRSYRRAKQSRSTRATAYRMNTIYMSPGSEAVEDSEV